MRYTYTTRTQKFIICPLGSPREARGTEGGAWVRFPLLAGGTLRRGLSGILVFVNFGCAIGMSMEVGCATAFCGEPALALEVADTIPLSEQRDILGCMLRAYARRNAFWEALMGFP
jgi:hypothetical protein